MRPGPTGTTGLLSSKFVGSFFIAKNCSADGSPCDHWHSSSRSLPLAMSSTHNESQNLQWLRAQGSKRLGLLYHG
ncbi:hypothetical protein HAX54_033747 [Datura stramonium]|uniref:Uncharacterized protein n=1 Tax=Datura stramonium TaxID=4076 RepID=A0ABS8VF36_DATST|nr:hypothetical protein [Datura stramonium]